MPASITHYYMANKSKQRTSRGADIILSRNKNVFFMGAQGPDFLFFSFGKKSRELASAMHSDGIKDFFRFCIASPDKYTDIYFSYLAGFICHYVMDYTAHPYVYYKTGFADSTGRLGLTYGSRHHFFETAIDGVMCRKYTGSPPAKARLYRRLICSSKEKSAICAMYKKCAKAAYGKKIRKTTFRICMNNFINFYRLTNSRFGIKRRFIAFCERLVKLPPVVSSLVHINNAEDYISYLNLSKKPWYKPWDNKTAYNYSFPELMDIAVQKAVPLINALYYVLYKNADSRDFLGLLSDFSFTTGLSSAEKPEFLFMEKQD